jgi:hypothetical protein
VASNLQDTSCDAATAWPPGNGANFRDPSSYFFAQQFPMRNKDVIYASNAESVEVVKFIAYANYITAGVAGL